MNNIIDGKQILVSHMTGRLFAWIYYAEAISIGTARVNEYGPMNRSLI
jgi:hypothetical protein